MPVMHQAVKAFLANQRQGNASTKTRGFVVGGNQKPWKQKGTGRARQGSTRAPQWVGGGTVFGPIAAQLCAVRAAQGSRTRPQERIQRPRSRERSDRRRCFRLRRAEDVEARRTSVRARCRRQESPDSHGRREAERVHQRPQSSAHARSALLGRLDVPPSLVGRRDRRVFRIRNGSRQRGRRRAEAAEKGTANEAAQEIATKKAVNKTSGRKSAAKKTTAKSKPAAKKSAKAVKKTAKKAAKKKGK